MTKQFENEKAIELDDKTATKTTAQKRLDQVADEAASKPAKTEQSFDKQNSNLFSK